MPKRLAPAAASSTKSKKAKTGHDTQQTIQSFFTKSTAQTSANNGTTTAKVGVETVVINLSLDEGEAGGDGGSSLLVVEPEAEIRQATPTLAPAVGDDASCLTTPSKKPSHLTLNYAATTDPVATFPDLTTDPLSFSLTPCPWHTHLPAPYAFLVHALVTLACTRSRITITNTLVNTLRMLIRYDARRSLLPALYMLSNCLGPSYEGVELNVGPSIITKAIQSVSGITAASLRTSFHKLGDAGDVAYAAKSSLRTLRPVPPLLLPSLFSQLLKIATLKGQASAKNKQAIVEKLLVAARGEEVRYLVRTLGLHLRVGAVRTTILTALGRALILTPPTGDGWCARGAIGEDGKGKGKGKAKTKEEVDPEREEIMQKMEWAEGLLKQVYIRHPHFGHIVDAVLEVGLEGLADKVQLAVGTPLHPTLGSPTRSLDEIYERLGNLAFSAEFKYDGQRVQSVESESGRDVVEEFWEKAVESQCEGLMIKLLDSGEVLEADEESLSTKEKRKGRRRKPLPATYEPGECDKRTSAWLKLKKDYVDGLGDSLDLVPIGGWHGIGRKAGWWSPILLGLWDSRINKFVGVCKCMSGFSDAFYKGLNERYSEELGTCSKVPFAEIDTNGESMRAWFKPSEVWEIKGADITLSPVSQAAKGLVGGDRGLSLRFPRFMRVREDKALTDASGPDFLAGLWRKQEGKGDGADEGELVDAELESEESESE
ncbi:hypothetical protein FRC06_000243 [Ceratobasidium sp. 370]|nr:hypothetical protein FRC06_000243 [Ceratobasidium sp. 370]